MIKGLSGRQSELVGSPRTWRPPLFPLLRHRLRRGAGTASCGTASSGRCGRRASSRASSVERFNKRHPQCGHRRSASSVLHLDCWHRCLPGESSRRPALYVHIHMAAVAASSAGPLKTVEKAAFLLQCVHFCVLSCCCLLRAPTRAAFQPLVLRMLSPLTCHLALFVCGDALAAPSPEGHIERHSVCVRSALLALPPPIAVNDSLLHQ